MSVGTFTRYPYSGPEDQLPDVFVQGQWSTARQARSVAHQLLQDSTTLYTLLPPEPRAGSMLLRFGNAEDAHAAAEFFSGTAEYDLFPIDPAVCSARFVVHGGAIMVEQSTGRSWTVTLPWREVLS